MTAEKTSNLKDKAKTSLASQAANTGKPFEKTGLDVVSREAIENIVLTNDINALGPQQQVEYIKMLCDLLGLNAITNPIRIIEFKSKADERANKIGKLAMYATKDCAEQLRSIRGVSIDSVDIKLMEGMCIVVVKGQDKTGRRDSSTGVTSLENYEGTAPLRGELKANAIMKAETKGKRRFTLSICGLGFLMDETEVDAARQQYEYDQKQTASSFTAAPAAPAIPSAEDIAQEEREEFTGLTEYNKGVADKIATLDRPGLTSMYNDNPALHTSTEFVDALNVRREELKKAGSGLLS